MSRELPAIIVIGAQKAGTSFLYELLAACDGLVGAVGKEGRALTAEADLAWHEYLTATFSRLPAGTRAVVDATPEYVLIPGLARTETFQREATLAVALLRDPIDRIVSQYKMRASRLQASETLDRIIEVELAMVENAGGLDAWVAEVMAKKRFGPRQPDFIARSAYDRLLPPWRAALGERLLTIPFGRLIRRPAQVAEDLLAAAGLPGLIAHVPSPVNSSGATRFELMERLLEAVRWSQRKFGWRMGIGLGTRLERLNRRDADPVMLSQGLRVDLERLLKPAAALVEELEN